jgi:cholesterol oxidase
MVSANNTAVKYDPGNPKYKALPDNYFAYAKESRRRCCSSPAKRTVFRDSNIVCYERLQKIVPGRHELTYFNYGHQDVFMGKNNHIDIFPRLLAFLEKHRIARA